MTEQQLVIAGAYSKAVDTPVMAIAFIQSVQKDKIKPEWMKHRVLNYVNQLAYLDRAKFRKKKSRKIPLTAFIHGGFFLLTDLVNAIKANEEEGRKRREAARLERLFKKAKRDQEKKDG